jgi:uncharacterized membrane protein
MLILLNYILVNIIWGIEPLVNKFFLKHISISTLMLIISIFYLICVMIIAYKNKNKLKTDLIKLRNYTVIYI